MCGRPGEERAGRIPTLSKEHLARREAKHLARQGGGGQLARPKTATRQRGDAHTMNFLPLKL